MSRERRAPASDHALTIRLVRGSLQPQCSCGITVTGPRYTNRTSISLADLLEISRLHASARNSRR